MGPTLKTRGLVDPVGHLPLWSRLSLMLPSTMGLSPSSVLKRSPPAPPTPCTVGVPVDAKALSHSWPITMSSCLVLPPTRTTHTCQAFLVLLVTASMTWREEHQWLESPDTTPSPPTTWRPPCSTLPQWGPWL